MKFPIGSAVRFNRSYPFPDGAGGQIDLNTLVGMVESKAGSWIGVAFQVAGVCHSVPSRSTWLVAANAPPPNC